MVCRVTRTTAEFIALAVITHGDLYDYSLTEYVNSASPICVICRRHGKFFPIANNHLNGAQCRVCSFDVMSLKMSLGRESFVEMASAKHEGLYTYENVVYKNNSTKVLITCQVHGDVAQTPHDHLSGIGCPMCKLNGYKYHRRGFFYIYSIELEGRKYCGYGITCNPKRRNSVHRRSVMRKGGTCKLEYLFDLGDGWNAFCAERIVKKTVPQASIPIENFVTESCHIEHIDAVISIVADWVANKPL